MPYVPGGGANFSPNQMGYSNQGTFRFWCQKVLPLVYDDSLSYYELLCKVVDYLNNVISDVSNVESNVAGLNEAYNNLQSYVNTEYTALVNYVNAYFDNLDVQEEINTKLDEMAADGSLSVLLAPFIPSLVADWLDENITPTSPPVDATLSISGAAADAKATGDAIADINDALRDIKNIPFSTNPGVIGANGNIGTGSESLAYVYSNEIPVNSGEEYSLNINYSVPRTYHTAFAYYDNRHNFIDRVVFDNNPANVVIPLNVKYFRVTYATYNDSNIDVYIENMSLGYKLETEILKNIKYQGTMSADGITPDTVTDIGYWVCSSATTSSFVGKTQASTFINFKYGNNNYMQVFILADGDVFARRYANSAWSNFTSIANIINAALNTLTLRVAAIEDEEIYKFSYNGIMDNNTITPDNVTDVGYWLLGSAVTNAIIGKSAAAIFYNLRRVETNVNYQQTIITGFGEVYCRYYLSATGWTAWKAQNDFIRPNLVNPDNATEPGFYQSTPGITAQYVGETVSAAFLNLTNDNNAVYFQCFITSTGHLYCRYGSSGNFISLVVDDSLTISGTAADSKVVGDALSVIDTEMSKKMNAVVNRIDVLPTQIYNTTLITKVQATGANWKFTVDSTRNWIVYAYLVEEGDELEITGNGGSSYTAPNLIFASGGVKTAGTGEVFTDCIEYKFDGGRKTYNLVAPVGATVLYVAGRTPSDLPIVNKIEYITDIENATSLLGKTIIATTTMDTENPTDRSGVIIRSGDWEIIWDRTTNNHVPNLHSVKYKGNIIYTGNTDWVGPYAFLMKNPNAQQIGDWYRNVTFAYIVGNTERASDWLSLTNGGSALTPVNNKYYQIKTPGDFFNRVFIWSAADNVYKPSSMGMYTTGGGHTLYQRPADIAAAPADYVWPENVPTIAQNGVRSNRCISIKYYADDKEVGENITIGCNKFKIVWTNRIQASNTIKWDGTGLECLEETCYAEFTGGGNINVGVSFKPLVDILMGWYSGIQCQIHYLYDPENVADFDDTTAKMCYIQEWSDKLMEWARVTNDIPVAGGENLPAYSTGKYDVIENVTVVGKYATLNMKLDRNYGIARLRWPQTEPPTRNYFYTGDDLNRKGYYSIVTRDYSNPMEMNYGNIYIWRGYYNFSETDIDRTGLIN